MIEVCDRSRLNLFAGCPRLTCVPTATCFGASWSRELRTISPNSSAGMGPWCGVFVVGRCPMSRMRRMPFRPRSWCSCGVAVS